jgi:hypothetical protein
MKKSVLILALALVQFGLWAQAPAIQWQKALGGTGYDSTYSIQPTPDGGYIVAGLTYSTDGDVTGNHGNNDAWVMKLSATGAVVWQKALGGTEDDEANSIQPTADGGYIVAGYTSSTNGDVTANHGNNDAWVLKLSATGTIVWQKTLGGTSDDSANSIQPTSDGGYIMAGYTYSNNGDVTGNHGGEDAWVVKLSATGALVWQKTLGGTATDSANSIQPTSDGGYIVAVDTESTNGDVTGNHGGKDAWVVKLSATGAIVWQKTLGGTDSDTAGSVQPTPDGGYILASLTQSTNGDVTGNHGVDDAWVVKLDAMGIIVWQKALGGTESDAALNIQPTLDGGYILAGFTTSNDGDVTGNHGNGDGWVVKLGATGAVVWQKSLGGTSFDMALSIQPTTDSGCILAGFTSSTDGDVTGNHGSTDAWVVKLGPVLSTAAFEKTAVVVYPNPTKDQIKLQFSDQVTADKIVITDLTGKVILEQISATNQVDVSQIANGMYLLQAISGQEKFQTKFIKE